MFATDQSTAPQSQHGSSTSSPVRFLNLSVTDPREHAAIMAAVERVLDHGRVVLGPEVQEFEQRMASYCGKRHCVGVNSGTDALILGLRACGIGEGDEVITTPLSWLASASAILLNGATPVFGDVDETLNLDPETIEPLITARTKAILAVHFTGQLAPMPEILKIAKKHGLLVIEDGAQAFGATIDGTPCGAFGDMACISLNAMKILGGLGDGGVVLTDDPAIAERLDRLRHSGVEHKDYCVELSHNCRLDTLQAAILLERLNFFPGMVEHRRANAARYDKELDGIVATPVRPDGYKSVFYTYAIRSPKRDKLQSFLTEQAIETKIQHPLVMNDQPAFQGHVRGNSPKAKQLVNEILCIPVHEKLTGEEQGRVISALAQFAAS